MRFSKWLSICLLASTPGGFAYADKLTRNAERLGMAGNIVTHPNGRPGGSNGGGGTSYPGGGFFAGDAQLRHEALYGPPALEQQHNRIRNAYGAREAARIGLDMERIVPYKVDHGQIVHFYLGRPIYDPQKIADQKLRNQAAEKRFEATDKEWNAVNLGKNDLWSVLTAATKAYTPNP
jgi:hypothetical protein